MEIPLVKKRVEVRLEMASDLAAAGQPLSLTTFALRSGSHKTFTESLILAQDERWRRA
jgi:hypothetical protein